MLYKYLSTEKVREKEKIESHGNRDILGLATNQKDTETPKGVVSWIHRHSKTGSRWSATSRFCSLTGFQGRYEQEPFTQKFLYPQSK